MNKIVLKLGGTIMVLFLVVLLPLGYVANQIFTNFYYTQVKEEIEELSKKYALTITSLQDKSIVTMFGTLAELTNKDIYIINENGKVIADSGINLTNLTRHDIEMLKNRQPVRKRFHDKRTENRYLGSGYPIIQSDKFIGAIFVLAPINEVREPVKKIRDLLILSAIGALFIALGFTFLISKKMSRPLLEMEGATREIAKGNLDIQVSIPSNDEVGSLAQAINDLALETNRYRTNRREFFANISHELRTPISYLNGYSKILNQRLYQTDEERHQYLNIIEEESERLVRLINDMFDLSKMEEGKIDLHLSPVDITEVLESALLKLKIELEDKNLTLNSQIDHHIPLIKADGLRLEQIFINLLGNAIRYTENGTVSVKVWQEGNMVDITIEDTGIGIPPKDLPFIFERFHRVDKSRSRKLGGTGLGLAIVKHLVEIQNGKISVQSTEGKGTIFRLSFPTSGEEVI